jgi:sec-independent protein translocase protein TatB
MFDFSFGELAVIAVVALVVLGPERLPKVARTAGHLLGRARAYANQVKSDIDREVQMDELRKLQQQAQEAARSFETAVNDVSKNVEQEASAAQSAFTQINADYDAAKASETASASAPPSSPGSSAVADEIAALESSIAEQAVSQNKPPVPFAQHSPAIAEADAAAAKRKLAEDVR